MRESTMKLHKLVLCLALLVLCLMLAASSKPLVDAGAQDPPVTIYHEVPLSDLEHNDSKNLDFDHEAFLGEDAAEFDDLDPEESKRRLSVIVVSRHGFLEDHFGTRPVS